MMEDEFFWAIYCDLCRVPLVISKIKKTKGAVLNADESLPTIWSKHIHTMGNAVECICGSSQTYSVPISNAQWKRFKRGIR
jgi:hypothetical protein